LAWFSLAGGGVALLCGVACIAAVALAGAGVGAFWLSTFDAVQAWAPLVTGIVLLLLIAAWLVRYRLGGSRRQLRALQLSSALILVAVVWRWLDTA
jgi:hypothetical protein